MDDDDATPLEIPRPEIVGDLDDPIEPADEPKAEFEPTSEPAPAPAPEPEPALEPVLEPVLEPGFVLDAAPAPEPVAAIDVDEVRSDLAQIAAEVEAAAARQVAAARDGALGLQQLRERLGELTVLGADVDDQRRWQAPEDGPSAAAAGVDSTHLAEFSATAALAAATASRAQDESAEVVASALVGLPPVQPDQVVVAEVFVPVVELVPRPRRERPLVPLDIVIPVVVVIALVVLAISWT